MPIWGWILVGIVALFLILSILTFVLKIGGKIFIILFKIFFVLLILVGLTLLGIWLAFVIGDTGPWPSITDWLTK